MFDAGASGRSGETETSVSPRSSDTTVILHCAPRQCGLAISRSMSARSAFTAAEAGAGPERMGAAPVGPTGSVRVDETTVTVDNSNTSPIRIILQLLPRWTRPASTAIKKKCKSEARTRIATYIPAMVIGTGLDLVSVPRFDRFRRRHELRGLQRLFTHNELDYCLGLVKPTPSLAARFAAKEAFFKAAGTGLGRAGGWHDV